MRGLRAGAVGVVAAALMVVSQPSAALGPESTVTGTIERIIREAPGFGHSDPHEDADHIDGSSSEEVLLVLPDGQSLRVPDPMSAGLETGMRATLALRGSAVTRVLEAVHLPRAERMAISATGARQLPYALISVQTPDTVGTPATIEEVRRWLLDATQSFFDREAAGAFDFSVHSSHRMSLDHSLCGSESSTARAAKEEFGIPKNVGVILIGQADQCYYAGRAVLGDASPGNWVALNWASPQSKEGWAVDFYEQQGREVLIHEIGHNLGLRHSGRWACASGTSPEDPGATDCAFVEYGSASSVMGSGPEGAALDAHQRWQLAAFGPGRMLSTEVTSGSAVILEDRTPYSGPDDGKAITHDGRQVVHALHVRDGAGEAWLVARDPLITGSAPVSLPAGIVAVTTTGNSDPVQVDTVTEPQGHQISPSARIAAEHDIIPPGSTFTTPGGTRITVSRAMTTPYGEGFLVEWIGTESPVVVPRAPEMYAGFPDDGQWLRPGNQFVNFPDGVEGFQTCAIVDDQGVSLTSWRTGSLLPAPGTSWWREWTAWSPELQQEAVATFRLPLTGRSLDEMYGVEVDLPAGVRAWRTQCRDFQGRTVTSTESMTTRVDGTPPRLGQGSLEVLGLAPQRSSELSNQIAPLIQVRVPAFVDDESGFDRNARTGACPSIPANQSGTCDTYGSGPARARVTSGAQDRAGNASATVKASYTLAFVNVRPPDTSRWAWATWGAIPTARGATTTAGVKGRSAAIYARCGPRTGVLEISVDGGRPQVVRLNQAGSDLCTAAVLDLPKGRASLRLAYSSLGGSDLLFGVVVLK